MGEKSGKRATANQSKTRKKRLLHVLFPLNNSKKNQNRINKEGMKREQNILVVLNLE